MRVIATMRKLLADRQAATTVEYGLILALVFLGMIGAAAALGGQSTGLWGEVHTKTASAMEGN